MIDKEEWRSFEDDLMRREHLSLHMKLKLMEEFYQYARAMGAIPMENPLEGLDVIVTIAKVINSVSLKKLSTALAKANIPYMVIGGQAVLIYGEPRFTKDIDLTLGVGVEGLETILGVTKKLGLKVLVDDPDAFVRKTMVLPASDERSKIRVDFVFSFSPFERQAIKRAKRIKIGHVFVKFATLEDVVIHKIFAGRPRDLEDVRTILLKNPKYDKAYM